jgi:hypothetical protein
MATVTPRSGNEGIMHPMHGTSRTITIQNAAPGASGCGHCLHGDDGEPVCRTLRGDASEAPQINGPADEVQRLMAALAPVLGFADESGPRAGAGLMRALSVLPGEVELQLAVGRHCGGAALADSAFETLRSLLPDTDVYVTLAA